MITHMIMIIITSGSRILVARIIQFEVESNCETFLQMSIISAPHPALSVPNVNVTQIYSFCNFQLSAKVNYFHYFQGGCSSGLVLIGCC